MELVSFYSNETKQQAEQQEQGNDANSSDDSDSIESTSSNGKNNNLSRKRRAKKPTTRRCIVCESIERVSKKNFCKACILYFYRNIYTYLVLHVDSAAGQLHFLDRFAGKLANDKRCRIEFRPGNRNKYGCGYCRFHKCMEAGIKMPKSLQECVVNVEHANFDPKHGILQLDTPFGLSAMKVLSQCAEQYSAYADAHRKILEENRQPMNIMGNLNGASIDIFSTIFHFMALPTKFKEWEQRCRWLFVVQDIHASNLSRMNQGEKKIQEINGQLLTNNEAAIVIKNYMQNAGPELKQLIIKSNQRNRQVPEAAVGRWRTMDLDTALDPNRWKDLNIHVLEIMAVYAILIIELIRISDKNLKENSRLIMLRRLCEMELLHEVKERLIKNGACNKRIKALVKYIRQLLKNATEMVTMLEYAQEKNFQPCEIQQFAINMGVLQFLAIKEKNSDMLAIISAD